MKLARRYHWLTKTLRIVSSSTQTPRERAERKAHLGFKWGACAGNKTQGICIRSRKMSCKVLWSVSRGVDGIKCIMFCCISACLLIHVDEMEKGDVKSADCRQDGCKYRNMMEQCVCVCVCVRSWLGLAVLCMKPSRETGPVIGKTSGGRVRGCQLLTSLRSNADCSPVSILSCRRLQHCQGMLAFYGLLNMWGAVLWYSG